MGVLLINTGFLVNGNSKAASEGLDWDSPLVVELWGIRDGLKLALDHNWDNIIVDMDASAALLLYKIHRRWILIH